MRFVQHCLDEEYQQKTDKETFFRSFASNDMLLFVKLDPLYQKAKLIDKKLNNTKQTEKYFTPLVAPFIDSCGKTSASMIPIRYAMNNNLTQQKLTSELWKLYNFIKERTLEKEKTTVKDICDYMPTVYTLNAKQSHFSNCPKLYKDIDTLNASGEIEKIIVKDNNNFYLATEEQAIDYAEKVRKHAIKQFRKYWNVVQKISSDGYGKLISAQGTVIDENSKARPFVEAFIKEAVVEEVNNADTSV